jgi:hypothetical protein
MDLLALFRAWSCLPVDLGMSGWKAIPLMEGDQLLGVAVTSGTEIHFAARPESRGAVISRRRCREFLGPLLEKRGYLTTRAVPQTGADEFLRRLGFKLTRSTFEVNHYMLTALPFGREN